MHVAGFFSWENLRFYCIGFIVLVLLCAYATQYKSIFLDKYGDTDEGLYRYAQSTQLQTRSMIFPIATHMELFQRLFSLFLLHCFIQ